MTSTTTTVLGDNAQIPGVGTVMYRPDQLIGNPKNLVTNQALLAAGTYVRGTVLGMQSANALEAVAASTNTGDGTIGTLSTDSLNTGAYTVTATSATEFAVVSPEGVALGTATVGTAFTSTEIGLTLTAGATAFVVGDLFTVTVYAASGLYVESVRTATDGSQTPLAILVDNVTLTAPGTAGIYEAGEFNLNAMTYDSSWTPALLVAALRLYGIFAKASISAASPSNNSAP